MVSDYQHWIHCHRECFLDIARRRHIDYLALLGLRSWDFVLSCSLIYFVSNAMVSDCQHRIHCHRVGVLDTAPLAHGTSTIFSLFSASWIAELGFLQRLPVLSIFRLVKSGRFIFNFISGEGGCDAGSYCGIEESCLYYIILCLECLPNSFSTVTRTSVLIWSQKKN